MSADHVWRVVIDHKPDTPPDPERWLKHIESWSMYDQTGGPFNPDDPYPLDLDEKEIQRAWEFWRGGSKMRYLSKPSATSHIERLAEFSVIAHLERGTVAWERWPKESE